MENRPNTGTTLGCKTGWSTANTLRTGDPNAQVTMQAEFPETGTYTMQFTRGGNPKELNPIVAEALVTWVVEGNTVTRRINIGTSGCALSGTGQAVRVRMVDATPSLVGPPGGLPYGVSVLCTLGVRGSSKQPPTLVPRNTDPPAAAGTGVGGGTFPVAGGASYIVDIPDDAGAISLFVTALTAAGTSAAGAITVKVLYAATVIQSFDPVVTDDWVPILPGATRVEVTNNSGTLYNTTVTFGIEG
jgi:hypothetical protein